MEKPAAGANAAAVQSGRLGRVGRAFTNPGLALAFVMSHVRGNYYRLKYKLFRQRVIIGRNFRVQGKLDIRGPGTVIFGDNCGVVSTRYSITTPWTHTPEAVIRFGNNVLLTGTRLGCANRIEVADYAGLSDARILDSDFHAVKVEKGHRGNSQGRSKPVIIGRNVWLAAGSMVLKGVNIGENAVVGAGSVVAGNVPANAVVFGNPARVIWRVRSTPSRETAAAISAAPPSSDNPAPAELAAASSTTQDNRGNGLLVEP